MTAVPEASRTGRRGRALSWARRKGMLVEVTCRCGWRCRGTEEEVIGQVRAHGRSAHGIETTADEVRAIWRVVGGDTAGSG
jgi:uncharacterized protein DUF1059